MNVEVIFAQMLMLFAMMLTGYWIWKKEWFDEAAYQKLSKIVVNILNPILVITGWWVRIPEAMQNLYCGIWVLSLFFM